MSRSLRASAFILALNLGGWSLVGFEAGRLGWPWRDGDKSAVVVLLFLWPIGLVRAAGEEAALLGERFSARSVP